MSDDRAFNYVTTAYKPESVQKSVTGHFTSAEDVNLLLAKTDRIEIFHLTEDGLVPFLQVPIYGRVETMQLFKPKDAKQDRLFVCTERGNFCVLTFKDNQIETLANGDLHVWRARAVEVGQIGVVDSRCRCIVLHLYEGMLKIIPMDPSTGQLSDAFDIRLDELHVLDIVAVHSNAADPQIALLYSDANGARHIASYTIKVSEQSMHRSALRLANAPAGSRLLQAVPAPLGGVLVAGEQCVAYVNAQGQKVVRVAVSPGAVSAFAPLDAHQGGRWLVAQADGSLHALLLKSSNAGVDKMEVATLGRTACAACLSYLDSGVLFLGSVLGDSQLLLLRDENDAQKDENDKEGDDDDDDESEEGALQVLETFSNLGPIVDMACVDLDRDGQCALVTCSGAFSDGTLRVVRNGVGLDLAASVELAGVRRVWALRGTTSTASPTRFLVLSFAAATRVLALGDDGELEETSVDAFAAASKSTLVCSDVPNNCIVHATADGLTLTKIDSLSSAVATWSVPDGGVVSAAAANNAGQVLVALGGGALVYIECTSTNELKQQIKIDLPHEAACVDVTPLQRGDNQRATLCGAGLWRDATVRLFALPSLAPVASVSLGAAALPRSLLLAALSANDDANYVLCGLGDGALLATRLDKSNDEHGFSVGASKRVALGTQAVQLAPFSIGDTPHVFAALDRPAVLYASERGQLRFANVDARNVTCVAGINTPLYQDSLCLCADGELSLGRVDRVQRLHVRTHHIDESPRRIVHLPRSNLLVVLTVKSSPQNPNIPNSMFVRLYDGDSFELLDSLALKDGEVGLSLLQVQLGGGDNDAMQEDDNRTTNNNNDNNSNNNNNNNNVDDNNELEQCVVVGTAHPQPQDDVDPSAGRLLLLSVRARRLVLRAEAQTAGAVFSLASLGGTGVIAAGVNSSVTVWRWRATTEAGGDNSGTLRLTATKAGHTVVAHLRAHDNVVIVGDLWHSVTVWRLEQGPGGRDVLQVVARDPQPNFVTALEMLDDDTYLSGEGCYNLFSLRRDTAAATDFERFTLETIGEYHIGDMINVMRPGSLVMSAPDSDAAAADGDAGKDGVGLAGSRNGRLPSVLYGTRAGGIGVVASLDAPTFALLRSVEQALADRLRGVGGLSHHQYRAFRSTKRRADASGFVDGDLLESYLELPADVQAEVASKSNSDAPTLIRLLEFIVQATH